jgi:type VI secretion system secreted protein VgrG
MTPALHPSSLARLVPFAALLCAACGSSSHSASPASSPQAQAQAPDGGPGTPFVRTFLSFALTRPILGTAGTFAILGGSAVTNTGPTTSDGDVGVWPGKSITDLAQITIVDTIPGGSGHSAHEGDAVAQQAQSDVTIAYDALAGEAPTLNLTGQDLGGLTLVQGVYKFDVAAQLTGRLTLDAQGDQTAIWIFQIGSTLTTASASNVLIVNGGQDCAVFWQVGSSATLGTGTTFKGSILALQSITLTTGATLSGGRALARNGQVTLDSNTLSAGQCSNVGPSQPCD